MRVRFPALLVLAAALLAAPATAAASQMIDRNAKYPSISVMVRRDGTQVAMVQYYKHRYWHHVLVWGAVNAKPPDPLHPKSQVKFHVDYSGGYGSFGTGYWKKVKRRDVCRRYTGPALSWKVAACTMPNGSHWALQAWQRSLPNMGVKPSTKLRRAWELHVSHWTTRLPVLWLKWGWANAAGSVHYDHLYGKFTYLGNPIYGFSATSTGAPLDSFGRNIYVDTKDRTWHGYAQSGSWYRFNSFLSHRTRGDFCASVYHQLFGVTQPIGNATAYRATAMGPGVTPIVEWKGGPPGDYASGGFPMTAGGKPMYGELPSGAPPVFRDAYDYTLAKKLNDEQRAVAGSSDSCYRVYGPHS